jgi:hypothetical protein
MLASTGHLLVHVSKTAHDANIGRLRLFLACQIRANAFGKDLR